MDELERRAYCVSNLEIRELDGRPPVIAGYPVVFDSWSEVMLDGRGRPFRERVSPTALDKALASGGDIVSLWNHNADYPLGRTGNGTLRLQKDDRGLHIEVDPPTTTWGADAVTSIRRGDVSGMSFTFGVRADTWDKGADGVAERTLLDLYLREVSPVTFPAYPATAVQVRSITIPDLDDESDGQEADEIPAAPTDDRAVERTAMRRRRLNLLRS